MSCNGLLGSVIAFVGGINGADPLRTKIMMKRRPKIMRGATRHLPFDPLRFCHPVVINEEERIRRVREAAYLRAELRGFQPGREAEDWAAAELQVDADIAAEYARTEPRCR